jgi:hypothetical protein
MYFPVFVNIIIYKCAMNLKYDICLINNETFYVEHFLMWHILNEVIMKVHLIL